MLKLDPKGEKFSAECAYRVFASLTRHKKCTVKTMCAEAGVSKVTVGRVVKYLMRTGMAKKYPYRPITGRGAKPSEYCLNPKISCAVLDLRCGELELCSLSVPRFCAAVYSPRIRSDRPLSDKAALLKDDCFRLLKKSVPDKYLISFSVLTDKVFIKPDDFPDDVRSCIPDEVSDDARFFTSEELEARFFEKERPGDTVVYVYFSEHRKEALVFKGGRILRSEDISKESSEGDRELCIPSAARRLTEDFRAKTVYIFTPYASSRLKNEIADGVRRGANEDVDITFINRSALDHRKEAAAASVESLTGETEGDNT